MDGKQAAEILRNEGSYPDYGVETQLSKACELGAEALELLAWLNDEVNPNGEWGAVRYLKNGTLSPCNAGVKNSHPTVLEALRADRKAAV